MGASLSLGACLAGQINLPLFPNEIPKLHADLTRARLGLTSAVEAGDFLRFEQSLVDMLTILECLIATYGFDDYAHFGEVHSANMRKLGPDGKPIYRADGKVIKPAGWTGPNHEQYLA